MLDRTFGYEIVDGKYRVQKTEAGIVRTVMEKVISGESYFKISKQLNADKVKTRKKAGNGPIR